MSGRRISSIKALRTRLIVEQDYKCYYCEHFFTYEWPFIPTLEHIIPSAKGGIKSPDNVAVSCILCNQRKADSLDVAKGAYKDLWTPEYLEQRIRTHNANLAQKAKLKKALNLSNEEKKEV